MVGEYSPIQDGTWAYSEMLFMGSYCRAPDQWRLSGRASARRHGSSHGKTIGVRGGRPARLAHTKVGRGREGGRLLRMDGCGSGRGRQKCPDPGRDAKYRYFACLLLPLVRRVSLPPSRLMLAD